MRTYQRIRDHINGPCRDDSGRPHVFLPQWRMKQIRWEEAIVRSRAKREGCSDLVNI